MAEYENLLAELEKERNLRIAAEERVKLLESELLSSSYKNNAALIEEKTLMEKKLEELKHEIMSMRMEREKVPVC